jgi:hypothetical protein
MSDFFMARTDDGTLDANLVAVIAVGLAGSVLAVVETHPTPQPINRRQSYEDADSRVCGVLFKEEHQPSLCFAI